MPKAKHGMDRLTNALRYSRQGLQAAWREEAAFREEAIVVMLSIPLAWWLGDTPLERVLLIASVLLVLIVELLNSAIEAVVDRIGTEQHELAGRAKDMGSAAVLLTIFLSILIWLGILFT
ncbi:diacylglycerol kinase [Thiofilum flexile]|uniref:diacylglycerol kinase n=1 Tax=Thiofilum flexile TaxID=125627 RepID=UPI00036AF748|nr:diacylglycerol kinase [Thiofilum flexile]